MNYHDSQRLNTKTTTPRLLQIVAGIGRAKSCGIGTENNGDPPPVPSNNDKHHDSPRMTFPTNFNDYSRLSPD
jgi:hypothetical protein